MMRFRCHAFQRESIGVGERVSLIIMNKTYNWGVLSSRREVVIPGIEFKDLGGGGSLPSKCSQNRCSLNMHEIFSKKFSATSVRFHSGKTPSSSPFKESL